MAVVRAGLVLEKAVTLLEVDHEKLSIQDLTEGSEAPFVEMLTSFGTVLPEMTPEGYFVFIDFDRKRYVVRKETEDPIAQELGQNLPAGWERHLGNIYIPDTKKKSTGVYQFSDPKPASAADAEEGEADAKKPVTGIGGAYVLKMIEEQKRDKGKLKGGS